MKKFFMGKSIFLAVFLSLTLLTSVRASSSTAVNNASIASVSRLGLIKGDTAGNLRLDDKIIRSEMITIMVRALGLETDEGAYNLKLDYKDIESSHWAYGYIKIALKYNLIAGYPDKTIAPDKSITYSEALTLIIRVLGYSDILKSGIWPDNVMEKCNQLGITKGIVIPKDKEITRGEVATLIYNSLLADYKN